jgi:hypothetical protein
MKSRLIYPIVVVVFAAACGGDGEDSKAVAGQQYETVQEGSAAGVTSSIAGPGETLPPITNTNADTTSAFALNPNVAPMSPQPSGTVAGTMPPPSQPVYSGGSPAYIPPARTASPAPQRQTYVPPPMTSSTRPAPQQPPAQNTAPAPQQPAEEPAEGPAPDTDTSATTAPPPPAQTNTAPPPAEKPKQEEPQQEEPADEEPAEEPPPPPPPAL